WYVVNGENQSKARTESVTLLVRLFRWPRAKLSPGSRISKTNRMVMYNKYLRSFVTNNNNNNDDDYGTTTTQQQQQQQQPIVTIE
ncbi:hypothetical protein V1477_020013, partial [Vespula maculifrons]